MTRQCIVTVRTFPDNGSRCVKSWFGGDMPTTTCVHSTGNGSTLGPLTKRQGVGAGPVLRPEDLVLPKSENSAVSDAAGLLWPKNARKVGKSENRCSEEGNKIRTVCLCSSYQTTRFSCVSKGVRVVKTSKTRQSSISFCLCSDSGLADVLKRRKCVPNTNRTSWGCVPMSWRGP